MIMWTPSRSGSRCAELCALVRETCGVAACSWASGVQVFLDSSMPVVQHYEQIGKVHRFKADRDPDTIYGDVRKLFLTS